MAPATLPRPGGTPRYAVAVRVGVGVLVLVLVLTRVERLLEGIRAALVDRLVHRHDGHRNGLDPPSTLDPRHPIDLDHDREREPLLLDVLGARVPAGLRVIVQVD